MENYFEADYRPTQVCVWFWGSVIWFWSHSSFKNTLWVVVWSPEQTSPAPSLFNLLTKKNVFESNSKQEISRQVENDASRWVDDGWYSNNQIKGHDIVSGWYRALLISLSQGGWRCIRVDEYSSRRLINDEGRQCWEAHNTLDCSTVVFASSSSTLVCLQSGSHCDEMLSLLLHQHTSYLLPRSLLPPSILFLTFPCLWTTSITIYFDQDNLTNKKYQ